MKNFLQIYRIVISVFILTGLIFLSFPANGVQGTENGVKQVTLKIEGMTCPSCPAMVKTALKRLDGVNQVDVSYKEAKAYIHYQDEKVTVEDMIKAIEGIGMKASPYTERR